MNRKFVKPYDHIKMVRTKPSSHVEKEYRLVRDSHGNCSYVEVGERDVREYVQSFTAGCSLKSLIERTAFMPLRDKLAYLNQRPGVGADLTNMPSDGTEAHILISRVKKLVPDFGARLKAGESFETIVSSLISNQSAASAAPSESEVKSDG